MLDILILIGAFLIGSIPFGLILTRLAGFGDIRTIGSGNIGATNVMRTGRKGLALMTLLLDAGKGALAVWMMGQWEPKLMPYAALLVVLGHCFTPWLRFKGGKGVATSLGALTLLSNAVGLMCLSVWALVFFLYKTSSVAALVSALLAPFFAYALADVQTLWITLVLSLLLIVRHASNIQRLITGEERQLNQQAKMHSAYHPMKPEPAHKTPPAKGRPFIQPEHTDDQPSDDGLK